MNDSRGDSISQERRVALFGGSFDPPHLGHLAIATAAADAFALDAIIFAPTGLQPLKPQGAFASYHDRYAMVSLLCRPDPRFVASNLDQPRSDGSPNYTVNTLEDVRRQEPASRLFAIAGADSFLDLPRWHQAQRLLGSAEWIVVSRPGFSLTLLPELSAYRSSTSRIHLLDDVQIPTSATELRFRLARGLDCSDSLPESVTRYIIQHHLYRS